MKTVYQLDASGLYVGPVMAEESPLEPGVYLIPRGCVETAPPQFEDTQVAKWSNGSWAVVPDFRGFKYWTPDRKSHVITEAGIEPPANHLTADPGPTPAELAAQLQQEAQMLLNKSDQTVGRCYEGGVPVPEAWKAYRSALRTIVSTGVGSLPNRPEYPAGT
jgi:hypothetical protein